MGFYPINTRIQQYVQGATPTALVELLKHAVQYHQKPVLGSTKVPLATVTLTADPVLAPSTTFLVQPDVPRNIILTGNAGANEVIRVNGTDAGGATIYEDFTLSDTTPQVGAKAFKSFTSVVYPTGTHTCAFVLGNVLGLPHILLLPTILFKCFDGSVESGTLATSATVLALNTYAPAGTLNGSKYVDLIYLV